MIDSQHAALIMIDMQNGFISPSSALCVAGAQASVPACAAVLHRARVLGMPVFHVRRAYAADGSDVEPVRYRAWLEGGRPLCAQGDDPFTLDPPDVLCVADGERLLVKSRFSAFFDTPLHSVLSREGVGTVVLIGTTTPNCIRSTCYDALSLNYNVVVVEDATSSRTPEVQRANIEDMAFIGAHIMASAEFCELGLANVPDVAGDVRAAVDAAAACGGAVAAACGGRSSGNGLRARYSAGAACRRVAAGAPLASALPPSAALSSGLPPISSPSFPMSQKGGAR